MENKVIIYTDNDGKTKIDVKLEEETLWLTFEFRNQFPNVVQDNLWR